MEEASVAETRNAQKLVCARCGSVMVLPGVATLHCNERPLPDMTLKKNLPVGDGPSGSAPVTSSLVRDFWLVKDKMSFENMGFSNQVDHEKFLVCADCEIGPVGYHDLATGHSFVAHERVKTA